MNFDVNLLFFGTTPYQSVADYQTLVGVTASTGSTVINLGVAEDMGIGDGEAVPKIALYIGNGITSSCGSLRINTQFQGSTNSTNWTTYAESGALATSSYTASSKILPLDVPHRPAGASLPQYYRIYLELTGNGAGESISTGSIFGGLVIQREDNPVRYYASGFSVA